MDSSQHFGGLKLNKIVNQEDQVLLTEESYNSTSLSVTGLLSTGTSLQGLFLQYLYKTVITILCLCDLYKDISMVLYIYCHYNRLYIVGHSHSWISYFLECDFFLFLFFFGINLCGPTLLGFLVGCTTTSVKITLSSRSAS